jgi:hypothetical protein
VEDLRIGPQNLLISHSSISASLVQIHNVCTLSLPTTPGNLKVQMTEACTKAKQNILRNVRQEFGPPADIANIQIQGFGII